MQLPEELFAAYDLGMRTKVEQIFNGLINTTWRIQNLANVGVPVFQTVYSSNAAAVWSHDQRHQVILLSITCKMCQNFLQLLAPSPTAILFYLAFKHS